MSPGQMRVAASDVWEYHAGGSRACVHRVQRLMCGDEIVDSETVPAYVVAAQASGGDLSGWKSKFSDVAEAWK